MTGYKFKKYDINSASIKEHLKTFDFGVDYDSLNENEKSLFQINSYRWTVQEVQNILDKISTLEEEEGYDYQVEGGNLGISIYTDEVYFFDLTNKKETEEFIWSTEKFISFLNEFKAFLEENQ